MCRNIRNITTTTAIVRAACISDSWKSSLMRLSVGKVVSDGKHSCRPRRSKPSALPDHFDPDSLACAIIGLDIKS